MAPTTAFLLLLVCLLPPPLSSFGPPPARGLKVRPWRAVPPPLVSAPPRFLSQRYPTLPRCLYCTRSETSSDAEGDPATPPSISTDEDAALDLEAKRLAYDLLDCLTSTKDEDSPEYNYEKDVRRDAVLRENDYSDLKMELRTRGLSVSGDKQEMMIRLLLHIIDPTMNFRDLSGREANLQFINEKDVKDNKVVVVPEESRTPSSIDDTPDAEDLMLYKRPLIGGTPSSRSPQQRRIIMDGLTRQEVQFRPLQIRRPQTTTRADHASNAPLGAYVVGGRDVLRTWERNAVVVVLVPDERGWRSRSMRILADEIAFYIQAIVVMPEVRMKAGAGAGAGAEGDSNAAGEGIEDEEEEEAKTMVKTKTKAKAAQDDLAVTFDDIVSAMDFARYQYDCRSLCLAGIGAGANAALRVASELTDVGHLLAEKDVGFYSYNGSSLAPDRLVLDPSIAQLTRLDVAEYGEEDAIANDIGSGLLVPVDGVDAAGPIGSSDSTGEEEQWMAALKELGERYDEEERMEFESKKADASTTTASPISPDDTEDVDSAGIDDETILDAIFKADAVENNTKAEEKEAKHIRREQALQARTDATESALSRVREANKRSAIRAFRGRFVSENGALTPKQIIQILPQAVLALCPDTTDASLQSLVGNELRVPACVILGDDEMQLAERMQTSLSGRRDEIIDYSIRVYEKLGARSFRDDRVDNRDNKETYFGPVPEDEVKARQDSVVVGSFWLDVYSRSSKEDRTLGIGINKYSELDALIRISCKDLANIPTRSSPVTVELHDDPTLFKNNLIKDNVKAGQVVGERVGGDDDVSESIIARGTGNFE